MTRVRATGCAYAIALGVVLAGCSSDDPPASTVLPLPSQSTSPAASPTPSPSPPPEPSPTAPTSPAASPSPQVPGGEGQGGVVLGGTELGVTRLGAPFAAAVSNISAVLGRPTADPATTTSCIGADKEVAWEGFTVADKGGKFAGWYSTSQTLQTPSGVTVGTRKSDLDQVYGASLELRPANTDNPPTFAVTGTEVRGALAPDGRVQYLFTPACGGP